MPLNLQDIQGRTLIELGRFPSLTLATAGSYTLFIAPSGTYGGAGGMLRTIVYNVVGTGPSAGATAATCTIGSNASNDWAASASIAIPGPGLDTVLYPVAAVIAYAPGAKFQVTVGTPGTGTMTFIAFGWTQ